MLRQKFKFASIFALIILFCSCSKEEGTGGRATVKGLIIAKEFDALGVLRDTYPAPEERVYIVYGTNEIYDDDTRTHFDGNYKFEFLKKGTYTLFAYSNCDTCSGGTIPELVTVEIKGAKDEVSAPDIIIRK